MDYLMAPAACPRYTLSLGDSGYPEALKDLEKPPQTLYAIGDLALLDQVSLAVIGARRATPYGLAVAQMAGVVAAQCGVPVVSGGAMGCDFMASASTLEEEGTTIIVSGCGADLVYPESSQQIFRAAWEGQGVVVSMRTWGSPPRKWAFPQRNQLIAALCGSLMVTEAALKSGTFSTAQVASQLGRNVYAVPGSIFAPACAGTNRLIRDGAAIVVDEVDLELLIASDFGKLRLIGDRRAEDDDRLIAALRTGAYGTQELAVRLGSSVLDVTRRLSALESREVVQRLPDGKFSLTQQAYMRHNVS